MNYKEHLIACGKRMLHSGLTVETWGNISVRDPETGLIYLTPSGMPYDSITGDDIVVMRPDGTIAEGFRKPTVEWAMHLGIMNARRDVNAIIHTHPIYSQVFAVLHEDIPPVIDEAAQAMGGDVKTAEYAIPGTKELAQNALAALGNGAACLLANHGAVCVGKDANAAFKVCNVLEMTAHIYYMARSIGEPEPISRENVEYMKDFAANSYGQDKN